MKFYFGYSTWLVLVGGAVVGTGSTCKCNAFVLSGPLKPLEGLLTTPSIRDKLLRKGDSLELESFTADDSYYTTTDVNRIKVPYQYTNTDPNNDNNKNTKTVRRWGDEDRDQLKNGRSNANTNSGGSAPQQSLGQQLAVARESLRERDGEVQELRSELRVVQARLEKQEDEYERYISELRSQLGVGAGQRRWSASQASAQTQSQSPLNPNNSNSASIRSNGFLSRTPDEEGVPTTDFHGKRDATSGFYDEEPVPFGGNHFAPHFSRPERRTALWSNGPSPAFENREYAPDAFAPHQERYGFSADQGFDERHGPVGQAGYDRRGGYGSSYNNNDPWAPPTLAVDGNNMDVHGSGKRTNPGFNIQGDNYSANDRTEMDSDFFYDFGTNGRNQAAQNSLFPRDNGFSSRSPPPSSQFQPMWQQDLEFQQPPMSVHYQQTPLITLNDQGTTTNGKSETIEERAAASGYYGDGDRSRTRNDESKNPQAVFHDLNNNNNANANRYDVFNNNGFSSVGSGAIPYVQRYQPQAFGATGQFVRNDDMGGGLGSRSQQQQSYSNGNGQSPFYDNPEEFFENGNNGQDQYYNDYESAEYGRNNNVYGEQQRGGPPKDRYAYSSETTTTSGDPNVAYGNGYSDSNNWNNNGQSEPGSGFSGPNSNFQFETAGGGAPFNQQQQVPFSPFVDSMQRRQPNNQVSVLRPDESAFN
jgi:hypothetical protein